MAIVQEYHEHEPVSQVVGDRPVWRCKYVYLDGTQCDDVNATPGYPSGWAGSRLMTREAVDKHLQGA